MRTRLVPRAEWFNFFGAFTRQHARWVTTLWLLGPHIGAQVEARDLPLEGIVADPLATSISIYLGGMPGKNVEHPVAAPISVWLETTDEGVEAALGINSADGTTTLLELRSNVPPELGHRVAPLETLPLSAD
jgi:hypothetical protein